MSDAISPAEARAALAAADRSAERMRTQTIAVRVAMAGFAAASLIGLLILGLVPAPGGVIGGTVFIVGASIALAVVGASAKARTAGFTRRYLLTIGIWAVFYVAAVVIGATLLPGVASFWIPAAVLSALPGAWFAMVGAAAR